MNIYGCLFSEYFTKSNYGKTKYDEVVNPLAGFILRESALKIGGITELSRPGFRKNLSLSIKLGFKNTELG